MKIKLLPFLLLAVLLLSFAAPAKVQAQDAQNPANGTVSISFLDLGQKDLNIRVISEQEFIDFPVAAGRKVERAVLNLHLQHGVKLLPDQSDIVIAVNNEPVADILLTPDNAADNTLSVEIPLEALMTGQNELLLRFSQRLVQNGCSDLGSKDLWTKVFADSNITLTVTEEPEAEDLSQFPLPFSTFSALPGSPQISIVLPPGPNTAELSAAVQIAAALGQEGNWKTPPITAFTYDQADQSRLAMDALIVIDIAGRNPMAASAAPGITALPSPYEPDQIMVVVSGTDRTDLLKTVSMLTTRSARQKLYGSHLDPQAAFPLTKSEYPTQAKFSELGLTTKRVRGIGLHDLYYPIDIPYNWKTTSEASVEVHFRHGSAITSASLMSVYINGFEITDVRLDRRNDEDGRLVIQLSPRQIHLGRNWLHIAFNLHMPRENCKYGYFEEAWAEISAENSLVNLAHVVSVSPLDLQNMPSYLVEPNDLSRDLFVLPALPTEADLTAMVRLAAKLGTYSNTDTVLIQAMTGDLFDPKNASTNVIAIGSPQTNPLIAENDSSLPQPLTLDNGHVTATAGRELSAEELAGSAAYIEVMAAPWSRSDALLVLGSHSPDLLLRLVDILPTGGRRMNYEGNVAVVTPTQVTGLSIGDLAGVTLSNKTRKIAAGIFIAAFLVIVAVGGAAVYLRRKIKSKEPHEKN